MSRIFGTDAGCHSSSPVSSSGPLPWPRIGGNSMRENLKKARKEAGMTQQQMADRLGLTLRHYQKIEYAEIGGSFEVWDALEDLLGIHQRKLREISDNRPAPKENPQEH